MYIQHPCGAISIDTMTIIRDTIASCQDYWSQFNNFFQDLQVGVWGLYVTDLCSDHENHQNIKFLVPHMGFTGIQLVAHLAKSTALNKVYPGGIKTEA